MTASREKNEPRKLPMMPIRDMVIFPYMMTPFVVGRESSVRALEEALTGDRKIFLATQHDASVDEPKAKEIYQVGSICNIVQSVKMPDGNIKVLVEGVERAKSTEVNDRDGFFVATVRTGKTDFEMTPAVEQLMQRVTSLFEQYVKLQQSLNYETIIATVRMDEPAKLSDTIAANLQLGIEEKQELLAIFDPAARLARIADVLDIEIEKLDLDRNIQSRVKRQMERAQKEYYLNEKIKAIQKELGRGEKSEFDELRKKIETAGMPKEVLDKAIQELKKLEAMPPMSAESTVSRNYIDWLLAVPWKKRSKETRSIDYAEKVLNTDHYGLEKIKERILEFLAVRQLVKNPKGSILCFAGPPGVGKTSLGMSIAKATGRKFVRLSLGGMRDEAEIRGHRRTYIGALPGQIIQHMKRAGTKNPVFLLDEVDKMASDFRGDPASALLEVLDPEQNTTFQDHYLDVDYDLSQVLFVATANVMHTVPPALQDRMEVLRLQGYTEQEKLEIARQYLVKKQRAQTGLSEKNLVFNDDAILEIIRNYTREAGVRNLEREIGNVCRKVARRVVKGGAKHKEELTAANIHEFLGVAKFRDSEVHEKSESRPGDRPGLDRGGRQHSHHRSAGAGRQGQAHHHRPAGRRDAGVGAGRAQLHPRTRAGAGPEPRVLSQRGPAPARARRRDPQGRPFGRHHHGHGHGQRAGQDSGAARHRHDRRNHAARQGAGHRRIEGEAAGRAARRHLRGHPAPRQREGHRRAAGQHQELHEAALRGSDGRGAGAGAGKPAARGPARRDRRAGRRAAAGGDAGQFACAAVGI